MMSSEKATGRSVRKADHDPEVSRRRSSQSNELENKPPDGLTLMKARTVEEKASRTLNLEMETRQPIQLELNLESGVPGEARIEPIRGVEAMALERGNESRMKSGGLMAKVTEKSAMSRAWRKVKANKGSAGADGIEIGEFETYFESRWPELKVELESGEYQPHPVRRVEIEKPDGGKRALGIPTVLDRVIQQSMLEALQPIWEKRFHPHSYGFRPGKKGKRPPKHLLFTR